MKPGARLVNRTLALEMGTSTIPLREAISRLVSDGLLETVPGGGAFVRSLDPAELAELYDVRESIESLAAAEAAKFSTEHLLADLEAICEDFETIAKGLPAKEAPSAEQFERWLETEARFHTRVVEASRNRWLMKIVSDLSLVSQVFSSHRNANDLLSKKSALSAADVHRELIRILARRDSEAARGWMAQHIRTGRDSVLALIRKNDTTKKPAR